MKKYRCKCRKKEERGGRAILAPTEKGYRDVQTLKECQDWLISEYDLAVKRLTAERDAALDMVDTFMKALKIIVRKENENA